MTSRNDKTVSRSSAVAQTGFGTKRPTKTVRTHALPSVALLSLALLSSCVGGHAIGVDEAFCESVCEKVDDCGYPTVGCLSTCLAENEHLQNLRWSMSPGLSECVARSSCGALSGNYQDCFEEAQVGLPPSIYGSAYCHDYSSYGFSCGWYVSADECHTWFGGWHDVVLYEFSECFEVQCQQFEACLTERADEVLQ